MRQNGRVFYTANANSVGFRPDPVLGAGYPDGQAALQGDIAEVIIYDRALSDAEREAVGQYLAAKYAFVAVPAAPTNLTAVALSNTQVSLAWTNDPGNGVQFYEVERKAAGESGFASVATVADGMGYQDNTAVAGTAYTYRIRMRNYAGTSGYSNEANATTPTTKANGVPSTGLRLWLKADAGLTVGSVPYWPDQSGVASRGAAQVTVSAQPVLVANALNGRPVVHFSGGQRLALPANLMDGASAGEGFVVLKMATDNSDQGFWNLGPPGSPQRYTNGSGYIEEDFGSNANYTVAKPGLPLTQYHLYGVLAKAGLVQMRQNGRVFYTANANTVGFRPDPVLGAGYPDGQAALQGDIAEVIIYDRALGDAEREAVGRYLTAKYAFVSAPAAPTNLTAVALNNTQISLAWSNDPGNGVQFYEVERKAAGESVFASVATVSDGMGYQDNTAVPGTAYTYRIRMRNYAGTSGYSNEASATTPTTKANGVPTTGLRLWLKADAGLTVGSVPYWPDQSGIASRGAAQVTVSAQPALVTNALNGRPVVHFSGGQRLALPANLMDGASEGEGFVVLKVATENSNLGFWNVGSAGWVQRYANGSGSIEEDFGSNSYYAVAKPGLPLTQYHLYGVLAKTRLWQMRQNGRVFNTANANTVGFRPDPVLGAGYPDGQAALRGDIAEVIIYDRALTDAEREAVGQYISAKYAFILPPVTPTNLTAVPLSDTQVSLAWTNDPGNAVQFYEVQRQTGSGDFATVGEANDQQSYQDSGLSPGTIYSYRIKARDYAGSSDYSNVASAKTMPPAPTHLIASATSVTQVKLSWFDPSLESGLIYTLERQTGSTGFQVVTEIAGDLGYSDIGLAPNTTYSYRIKARNSSGSSLYSSLITVTTWRLPLPAPETGMRLWLSAESVVAGPSGVQVWPDLSGNGNDAIQDSSSNQPQLIANQLNGRAIVRFDGASSYLNLPNVMNGATAGDIFVVLRAQAANGADCRLYSMSGRLQYPAVDGQISDSFGSSTDHAVGSPGVDITQPHIYNATSANDQWTARIDLATLCTTATNVVSMGDGSSAPVLGADYSGPSATLANWFAGDVAEIIVYDHVLTDTERRNLQQLLAAKYGLPISFPGDSDNNALPDAWETQYFGQIGIDPNASNSGDGQTNYQKYLAGINPLDFYHGRALAITLDTAGNFYTYDASGRLSGASYPSGMTLQVGSDAAGNLVTFSGSGAIVQWRAAHNLPADGTGQGADNAIVANDGLPNLAKYAFGLDPAVPVTTDCPTVTLTRLGGSSYLTMTYLRPDPAPPELVYKVEVSTDGTTWAVNGTVDLGTAVNNGMATVVVRDATPVNWPNFGRRIRLAIERKARP
jgi:fibronectin type 3 domain-containing protein